MPKKSLNLLYVLVFLIVSIVFGLRVFLSDYRNEFSLWLPIIYWNIGGLLAWLFYYSERILDIYFGNSETKLALVVKDYFVKKNYKGGLKILKQNEKLQKRLIFRSVLFQVIWVGLMIFSISSTSSMFGKALVLGLGLRLFIDEIKEYKENKNELINWLFWPVNMNINEKILKKYLYIVGGLIALFVFMILR